MGTKRRSGELSFLTNLTEISSSPRLYHNVPSHETHGIQCCLNRKCRIPPPNPDTPILAYTPILGKFTNLQAVFFKGATTPRPYLSVPDPVM